MVPLVAVLLLSVALASVGHAQSDAGQGPLYRRCIHHSPFSQLAALLLD